MPKSVGLDLGGNAINVTAFDGETFLIQEMLEVPSLVREGPDVLGEQLRKAFQLALDTVGWTRSDVDFVGLDTPGPASATGVFTATGPTNFGNPAYGNFNVTAHLQKILDLPVAYLNDGNAAALYSHFHKFGADRTKSSVSLIMGTGLGGGIVVDGRVVVGKVGYGAELGHVSLPGDWNPVEQFECHCNCGRKNDLESVASLTGIELNLLPHYLRRNPDHPLAQISARDAARKVRGLCEQGDPLAREVVQAQAWAIAAHIDQMINVLDMDAVFIGGGGMQTTPEVQHWFIDTVRTRIPWRAEQRGLTIEIAPEGDMAGARGAAVYAVTLPTGA